MAKDTGRSAQVSQKQAAPDGPLLRWSTIAKVEGGYCLATMVTQGGRIVEQHLGKVEEHRPYVEDEYRIWNVMNVLDRGDG